MRLDLVQNMRQEMSMRLAPQIIQSIEILQLPMMELLAEIKEQLENNPVLEESIGTEQTTDSEDRKIDDRRETEEKKGDESEDPYAREQQFDYNYYEGLPSRKPAGGEDKKMEAMNNTAARPISLQSHLFEQFMLLDLDQKSEEIGEAIIFNLDNDGYLPYPLDEVIAPLGDDITLEDAEAVLTTVQSLDPPGIGARDLEECLLMQIGDSPAYEFERQLIRGHLDDIRKNKLPKVCKDTGRSMDEVKEGLHLISHLNPAPGSVYSSELPRYILPDIIVEEVDDQFVVRMEDDLVPILTVNPRYQDILRNNRDKTTKDFVRGRIEAAKWLIDSIHQRKRTIRRVATAIVTRQEEFLRDGLDKLQPLKMQDVADDVGIHVSTVSRAVGGKYMQTPQGIYPMKYFFTGGMSTLDDDGIEGKSKSILTVQQSVKDLIDAEDKSSPMSDDDIVKKLKIEGVTIARRTVTKYRKGMNIPSSRQRREY